MVGSIFVSTGCELKDRSVPTKDSRDKSKPTSSVCMNEVESKTIADKVPIHLYFFDPNTSKLMQEIRYIPIGEAQKSAEHLATVIVKELSKGPLSDKKLKPTISSETKLRSDVTIEDGTATVDFDKNFISKNSEKTIPEQMSVYSMVNSLTELREIKKVKFLVDGKSVKDFRGELKFDGVFPRCSCVISKPEATVSTPSKQPGDPKTAVNSTSDYSNLEEPLE